MPTECSAERFAFAPVDGRAVVASFDGGAMTSDAGALLLGATDRVLGLTRRLAACFKDSRDPAYVEHTVETLVMQRTVGIARGYEDLNDHDQLRHDPVMAVLAGKLEATRSACAPLAGKSTLNRLELGRPEPPAMRGLPLTPPPSRRCSSIFSSMPTRRHLPRSRSISTPPTIRCMGTRKAGSSMATTTATATCRSTSSVAATCGRRSCAGRTSTPRPARPRR
jgi:DDE family transposase